jgi:C1q domain
MIDAHIHLKNLPMKLYLLTFGLFFMTAPLLAQQPPLNKKDLNTTGKKDVRPENLKPFVPAVEKVAFSALLIGPRELLLGVDDNILRRFTRMEFNEGNGFDAASGVFTAPSAGYYCLVVNADMPNYSCAEDPVPLGIYVMKNTQRHQLFHLPVGYGSGSSSAGFVTYIQLNKGEKISLSPLPVGCTPGGQRPSVSQVIFSGYKIM